MFTTQRFVPLAIAFVITALSGLSSNTAIATVTVQTTDGRVIIGEVDDQTDDQRLWIRQEKQQIMLTSSLAWSEVTSVADSEGKLPAEQLPAILLARATSEPKGFILQQTIYHEPTLCLEGCPPTEAAPLLQANQRRRVGSRRVRSLQVDAFLVNLDRDVEPDGIRLIVAALDEDGLPVPVKGSLSVRLWGERIQSHGSLVRYEQIEQWSQRVDADDFIDGTASYPMRFRRVNPEFATALHSDALVNVRLSVSGQGNFEASVPVQIRAFNPVRDRLQLTRGGRFFPNELTENVRHQLPHRTHTRRVRTR